MRFVFAILISVASVQVHALPMMLTGDGAGMVKALGVRFFEVGEKAPLQLAGTDAGHFRQRAEIVGSGEILLDQQHRTFHDRIVSSTGNGLLRRAARDRAILDHDAQARFSHRVALVTGNQSRGEMHHTLVPPAQVSRFLTDC